MKRDITKPEAGCLGIWNFCEQNFNKPILCSEKVVRCIGYGECKRDCYVVVQEMGGKIIWHTGVGGYASLSRLKGQQKVRAHNGEIWDDLTRLDSVLSLNGASKRKEFLAQFDESCGCCK